MTWLSKQLLRNLYKVILVILSFCFLSSDAQKTFKGRCGIYYSTMNELMKQKGKELAFYQFKNGETVASIGAQCCFWEAAYAATTDSVLFYLEDIDTTYFNERQVQFA